MTLQALSTPRFVRKTQLGPNEYRKNFHQIDREVTEVITSREADQVTPLMSKIYLRLVNAPERFWERDGVLRIEAEVRDGKMMKAWAVLCDLVGVSSATASKALAWMHEQGIIGYFSGKNGVGLRIFLNRAVSSIGVRRAQDGKKILTFPPASSNKGPGSKNDPPFKDSYAVLEVSDLNVNSPAPKNGADHETVDKTPSQPTAPAPLNSRSHVERHDASSQCLGELSLDDVVTRLKAALEPAIHIAARQAAAREHERTREWLESRGLPKAARVAQHEAYNILKKYGVISESSCNARAPADTGRSDYTPLKPHLLSPDEIVDMAGACVAILETRGQSIELTLSEMSAAAGGFLLPEDVPKVRAKAESLIISQR